MAIDTTHETPIPFHEAPKHIPGRPHVSTLHRWRLNGARGRRLETFLRGGRRYTTLEAIQRFLRPDEAPPSEQPAPKLSQRNAAAERELDKLGI